jgi:hypothetical protein
MNKLKKAGIKVKMSAGLEQEAKKAGVRAGRYEMKNLVQCVRAGSLRALK